MIYFPYGETIDHFNGLSIAYHVEPNVFGGGNLWQVPFLWTLGTPPVAQV